MQWFRRDLAPGEDYDHILDEFGALFLGCRCPDGMVLGVAQKPGQAGALYATFPKAGMAGALDFTPCDAPTAGIGLIGHDDSLEQAFPPVT
jgi:hypothetical protein